MRQLGKAVALLAVVAGLNACASIPQRAWDNGRAMSRSDSYYRMMNGERGFHAARSLYSSMDARWSFYQARSYQPFARW